jgi:hypothetical protein
VLEQEQELVQELEQLVQVQVWRGPGDQGVSAPRATTPCSTSPSLGPRRAQGLRRGSTASAGTVVTRGRGASGGPDAGAV